MLFWLEVICFEPNCLVIRLTYVVYIPKFCNNNFKLRSSSRWAKLKHPLAEFRSTPINWIYKDLSEKKERLRNIVCKSDKIIRCILYVLLSLVKMKTIFPQHLIVPYQGGVPKLYHPFWAFTHFLSPLSSYFIFWIIPPYLMM